MYALVYVQAVPYHLHRDLLTWSSAFIEGMMFISHGIWFLRTRRLRKEAQAAGTTFDEYPPAVEWQSKGIDITTETLWAKMHDRYRTKSEQSDMV